jgi:hypothetical protein
MFRVSCTEHLGQIYLAGSGATSIFVYDVEQKALSTLTPTIPDQGATVAVWNDHLFVFQAKHITKINLEDSQLQETYRSYDEFSWWSYSTVMVDDMLYLVMVGN